MKKLAGIAVCALLSYAQVAAAYGLTWIDKDYDFSKLGQVTCITLDEYAPQKAEINLLKESKRVKAEFSPNYTITASQDMVELGKQVKVKTGADAFLVTKIVTNEDQRDYVEGRYFPVTMHEYVEVDGPDGRYIERERFYDINHYFPAHEVNLHKLEVDFQLYDANTGKNVFSFTDARRSYDHQQGSLFEDIAKEFFISLRDTPKQVIKTRGKILDFDSLQINGKINDGDKGNRTISIIEALASELQLNEAKIPNAGDYALRAKVFNYYDAPYWTEPSVSTSDKLIRSWSEKHKVRVEPERPKEVYTVTTKGDDRYGKVNNPPVNFRPAPPKPEYKEIVIEHKQYGTEINEYPGGYTFKAEVLLEAQVIDKKTGAVVFTYHDSKKNDKRADAWKELTKDFYSKLRKGIKK